MMITPAYDPTMDFVMESPQGTLAAYCVCTLERSPDGELVGYTDPIAVDPDYQGMGLGKAILSHSINQLVERGADAVELGTSSENLPMQRLAESVGYQRIEEKIWLRYERDSKQQ
jgi:ribosomal protein S18 acetylase RimI-like enzyme